MTFVISFEPGPPADSRTAGGLFFRGAGGFSQWKLEESGPPLRAPEDGVAFQGAPADPSEPQHPPSAGRQRGARAELERL